MVAGLVAQQDPTPRQSGQRALVGRICTVMQSCGGPETYTGVGACYSYTGSFARSQEESQAQCCHSSD